MSRFCTNCGNKLGPDTRFCPNCGQKQENSFGVGSVAVGQKTNNKFSNASHSRPLEVVNELPKLLSNTNEDKMALLKELYFSFEGRLNRKEFIVRNIILILGLFLIAIVLCLLSGVFFGYDKEIFDTIFVLPLGVVEIIFGIAGWSVTARRCHDLNKSGWWQLIVAIPLVNILFAVYVWGFRGTVGSNRYGDDPLQ